LPDLHDGLIATFLVFIFVYYVREGNAPIQIFAPDGLLLILFSFRTPSYFLFYSPLALSLSPPVAKGLPQDLYYVVSIESIYKCYRPLHRMASNNLALGAAALLKAGADPKAIAGTEEEEGGGGKGGGGGRGGGRKCKGGGGETPMAVARSAGAWEVVQLLWPYYTSSSSSSSS